MIPESDELEAYFEELKDLQSRLIRLGNKEITRIDLKRRLSEASKSWFRFSTGLHNSDVLDDDSLNMIDSNFQGILESTSIRSRASTYRQKLEPVISCFLGKVIVPIIQEAGNPARVIARQINAAVTNYVSSEELIYINEATNCLIAGCNRAAIMMLWSAAIARLHSTIEKIGFNAYNLAVTSVVSKQGNPYNRVSKSPQISSLPELQRIRDFDIIVVGMELWKYDLQIFQELDRLLGLRNDVSHPGMLDPSALDVQQYAMKLNTIIWSHIK